MSVLVAKREESKFEAIVYAEELHSMMIELMQRNFGIKKNGQFVRKRFAAGDSYEIACAKFSYLLQNHKQRIDTMAALLTSNLRAANSIYPTNLHELEIRRDYQNAAIVNCNQIIHELQRVADTFDIDLNIYDRYVNTLKREINLIKHWRQRDNKLRTHLG